MDHVPHAFDIDRNGLDEPPALTHEAVYQLVDRAVELAGDDFAHILTKVRRHRGHVAGICRGSSNEDGRRRLRNTLLKTTYVRDNVVALTAQVLGYRQELRKCLPKAMTLAIKLEEAELHLIEAYRRENEVRRDKAEGMETDLYPAVKDVAQQMFKRHHITHWHWSAADDERLARIAAILQEPLACSGK